MSFSLQYSIPKTVKIGSSTPQKKKKGDPLNCKTSSSDISVYHANFHEGHSNVGESHCSGMVVAGERHGMCKSAPTVDCCACLSTVSCQFCPLCISSLDARPLIGCFWFQKLQKLTFSLFSPILSTFEQVLPPVRWSV
jgi:hypothetical protein